MRGYFGIVLDRPCKSANYGTVLRTCYNFGAQFIGLIGHRYQRQCSDTVASYRHIPTYEFTSAEDFLTHRPYGSLLIGVEIDPTARDLAGFIHPERATYVFGPEDGGLSQTIKQRCQFLVQIQTNYCLNLAVTTGIVMYDRMIKL